ncbi:ABC transporter substrate-binding protein [Salinifilum ghardaiensis]
MTRFRRLFALLFALTLLFGVGACASRPHSDPQPPAHDPASAFPVRVELPGQDPVTLPQQPKRIVSLSPTATETLYEIGAGSEVVAADEHSNHPQRAPRTEMSALTTDAAAVAGHDPDLVIAPDSAQDLAEGLRAADVPVLLTPSANDLDEAFQQIEVLGRATGHGQRAEQLTQQMRTEIDRIVEETPKPDRQLSFYHEVSPDGYTAGPESFVGSIYERFGLRNIAEGSGKFPQLSEERVVQADPDLVFLADTKSTPATAEGVRNRPGWNTLTAVRRDNVVELDEDVASRWGPRVVDLVRSIGKAVTEAQGPSTTRSPGSGNASGTQQPSEEQRSGEEPGQGGNGSP